MNYRLLGQTGLKVSQIALGAANFGTGWGHGASEADSLAMLDHYAAQGGNFIDTADIYQFGESEAIVGRWLAGRRDSVVLATKFSNGAAPDADRLVLGNSRKAMVSALEASLERLGTDHIDLYWVHHPDGVTPSEEILRGLEDLRRAGKIHYAGLSNFPAWRAAHAATLDQWGGGGVLAALQFEYSLVRREPEADLLPAAAAFGLAPVTWSPLGGGLLTGKYRRGETGRAEALGGKVFQAENSAQRSAVVDTVLALAAETGASADQVALAWTLARGVIPLIGPRSMAQLQSNLGAAALTLDAAQRERLDAASAPAAVAEPPAQGAAARHPVQAAGAGPVR
ncbi:aldo/keto reductase [Bordetella genomosp. 1]|uniref:Oxidoreductase n=1 Tax=Bordetella genomosp. 1 TaxID=1395607 RepID=A0ABX4EVZ8_9BORD|nr:aldo/keto reductase [Bordetella genomosp. 1]OZI58655.1 oxidoreductase [Bordetella genomosp. 1]